MTEKENPNFIERFTVRMPDGMRDAIAERAKRNGRSMNSEIVQILEDALNSTNKPVGIGLPPYEQGDQSNDLGLSEELIDRYVKALKENTKIINEAAKVIKIHIDNLKPPDNE